MFNWLMACKVNFYDSEQHAGASYWPFIGFMIFFAGLMLVFIGAIKFINSRHQWNIFYDNRDGKDFKSPVVLKDRRKGIVLMIAGVVLIVISFFIL